MSASGVLADRSFSTQQPSLAGLLLSRDCTIRAAGKIGAFSATHDRTIRTRHGGMPAIRPMGTDPKAALDPDMMSDSI